MSQKPKIKYSEWQVALNALEPTEIPDGYKTIRQICEEVKRPDQTVRRKILKLWANGIADRVMVKRHRSIVSCYRLNSLQNSKNLR